MRVLHRMAASLPLLLCAAAGCTLRIAPPAPPSDPVTIQVCDYGAHLSLLLPTAASGGGVEYAYGWWEWFALNRDRWYHAMPLLVFPCRGTLGRREIPADGSVYVPGGMKLSVERAAADALRMRLDTEYTTGARDEVYNTLNGMFFVPHARLYWLGYNCNSAVADWLEAMGCKVSGCRTSGEIEAADR